jgi:uncharacterized protein (DUF697 family)
MAGLKDINSVWKNIKEIDLKPIRDAATSPVRITIAGALGVGKHTLAEQMRIDPARPEVRTQTPLTLLTFEPGLDPPPANLVILMVDATRPDFTAEQALVKKWCDSGKNVLVFINKLDLLGGSMPSTGVDGWAANTVLFGSVTDIDYLQKKFVPTVLEMLPQVHIALGRQFPLFRLAIAHLLINETCFSNAAYSFSTGLAEIVPVLDLPLNLTDMLVLTKTQAFLAYKLGLLVGFSTSWQDYLTEFGSVIGGGFVWRQAARSLVGLIPGWGIIPKVAIAYSGTYVVGQAILGWYLSGKHLTAKQMRELSIQAFSRGKDYARALVAKMPRRQLRREKKEGLVDFGSSQNLLPSQVSTMADETVVIKHRDTGELEYLAAGDDGSTTASQEMPAGVIDDGKKGRTRKLWSVRLKTPRKSKQQPGAELAVGHICARCGRSSSADAAFCQYCGISFETTGAGQQV